MQTMLSIAAKQILESVRDGRTLLACIVFLATVIASLVAGYLEHNRIKKEIEFAQDTTYDQWLTQGDKNPHAAAHYGIFLFKAPSPLAFFDPGINRFAGVSLWLEAHKRNDSQYRPARDGTSLERFGALTPAIMLQALMPLLAIVLAFDSIAGERERGTLRQLAVLNLGRRTLFAGKFLGICGVLLIVLLPIIAVMVLFALLIGGGTQVDNLFARIALLIASYGAYAAFFVVLSIAVSAVVKRAQTALVILVGAWALMCFAVPKLGSTVAQGSAPDLSRYQFEHNVNEIVNAGPEGGWDTYFKDLKEATLKQYGVETVEELPINFDGLSLQEGEEVSTVIYNEVTAQRWDTFFAQERTVEKMSWISPLIPLRAVSMATAGTSLGDYAAFLSDAESYRYDMVKRLNLDLVYGSRTGETDYTANQDLWGSIPAFKFRPEGLDQVLRAHGSSIALLAAWLVLAFVLAAAVAKNTFRRD